MRMLFGVLVTALFILTVGQSFAIEFVNKTPSKKIILFIHGLGGGAESFAAPKNQSWPQLMQADTAQIRQAPSLSSYATAVVAYPAKQDQALSVPQIVDRILFNLEDESIFSDYSEVVLIAHSLGGIVAKKLIVEANKRKLPFARNIKGVFLIAVPSTGSDVASVVDATPDIIVDLASRIAGVDVSRRLTLDLKSMEDNSFIQDLEGDWRYLHEAGSDVPRIYCAFETRPYKALGLLVPQSRTATRCDGPSYAEDADHISIAQPTSTDSGIYRWVRGRIATFYDDRQDRSTSGKAHSTSSNHAAKPEVIQPQDAVNGTEMSIAPADIKLSKSCLKARLEVNKAFLADAGDVIVALQSVGDGVCSIQYGSGAALHTKVGRPRGWPIFKANDTGKYSLTVLGTDVAAQTCLVCIKLQ